MVCVLFSSSFWKRNLGFFLTINRVHRTLSRRCSLSGSTCCNEARLECVPKNPDVATLWVSSPWFSSGSNSVVAYIYIYQISWYISWSPLFGGLHRPARWVHVLQRNCCNVADCIHIWGVSLKVVIPNNHEKKSCKKMINYGGVLGLPPYKETPNNLNPASC